MMYHKRAIISRGLYFFPAFYIVEWLVLQTIYKEILQFLGLKSAVYNGAHAVVINNLSNTVFFPRFIRMAI